METAATLQDSFKIVLIVLAATSSFFTSVGAFLLGVFVHLGRAVIKRPDELMTAHHTAMSVIIPMIFLTFGVIFHSFVSILFKFAYDIDFSQLTSDFLSFNPNAVQVPQTVIKIKDKLYYLITSAIPFLKAAALNTAALVYILIPLFYISTAIKILEVPKLLTSTHANTSIFAVVFYAFVNLIIGLMIGQIYGSVINNLFFSHAPQIDNLGNISSIGDYTTAKIKEWIHIGFGQRSNSNLF